MNESIREMICEMGYPEAVLFDGPDFDEAIVGVSEEEEGRVIYDYDKMVETLMEKDGISRIEAIEFIDYNTIRAIPYVGSNAPIILHKLQL